MEWKSFKENSVCSEVSSSKLDEIIKSLDDEEKKLFEAENIERKFIRNLVDRRKALGLTQTELARRTGLTQQVISNIEKCGRRPTLINLIRYLNGLNLNLNDIFEHSFN